MIVIADTGPLNYLVLIGAVDILSPLYAQVIVPEAVASELSAPGAPAEVREWIAQPPVWLNILPDPPSDVSLSALDRGERAAIALAVSVRADQILIDDFDGRIEAERRSLRVTGTLGVLAAAHRRGLLDFNEAITRLSSTSFYLSPRLVSRLRLLFSIPDKP